MPAKRTKLTADQRAIRLLEKAVTALVAYRDHVGAQTYSGHVTREPLRDLKELLREEKRGWSDI